MFRTSFKTTQIGLRNYSSQASKAQSIATSLTQKASAAAKVGVYYSKVLAELGKYVWVKEGLSPPTVAEFQKTFTTDLQSFAKCAINSAKAPKALIEQAQGFKKDDYVKFAAYAVQFLGIFALGEVIGRRNIYGYKKH